MKYLTIFAVLFGLALSAPTPSEVTEASADDDKLVVTAEFFPEEFKVYSSEHDIINILVPLNALNFDADEDEGDDNDDDSDSDSTLFFVEADIKDGVKEYKGVSVLKNKVAKKILETGTDTAAANDDSKTAFFGATDGIYKYNNKEITAEKYGSVTDSVISIVKANGSDLIYILNDKHELYEISEDGNKKVLIDEVVGAQQIVADFSNNIYYYTSDKEVFVANTDGIRKIEGLPKNPSEIALLKPPFIIENGIPVVVDNKAYVVYVNGSSELTDFEFAVKPTAYAMEATLIQYYAYNKHIYEYNVLAIIFSGLIEELKSYLDDKTTEIQEIATRSRNNLLW